MRQFFGLFGSLRLFGLFGFTRYGHFREIEITDVNKEYLLQKRLRVELMGRGYAWLDTGTHDSLLEAGEFIATVEKRQGLKMACIEEIAYSLGWIDKQTLLKAADGHKKNSYGDYLKMVADQKVPHAG